MGVVQTHRSCSRRGSRPSALASIAWRPLEALEPRVLLATFTWDGGGADANWSTAANWAGDALPATDGSADLVFPAAALGKVNVNDITPGAAFASIGFTGDGYSITGNAIALGAGGVTDSSADAGGGGNSFGLDAVISGATAISDTDPGAPLFLAGAISGAAGSISRSGGGFVVFDVANTYGGGTTLLAGDTFANNLTGSAFGSGSVTNTGGTLRGSGAFTGNLANNAGLAPGGTVGVPGLLATGSLDFGAGAAFGFNVTGETPGSGYDQLVVTGGVDLGTNTPFNEAGSTFAPAGGETLFFIVNDGTDAVTGTFAGLGQGATIDINGFTYEISYTGDSATAAFTGGNDIVLRAISSNDPPVNTVPGPQATDEDVALAFSTANGNAIAVADSGAVPVTVTVSVPGGAGTVALPPDAALSDAAAAASAVTVSGTVTQVNAALQGLSFTPALHSTAAVTLTVSSTDGSLSDSDNVAITINPVNDAPLNTVPGTQVVAVDGTLIFGSSTSNGITVGDLDAGGDDVSVTLTAANATVSLGSTTGVVVSGAPDAVDETTLTITGPLVDINAALNGTTFRPSPGFAGTANLQILTDDLGHSGAGGARSDADTINVTVSPPDVPNEPPAPAADVVLLAPGQAGAVIAVLANDTDVDGDALAVADVSAPAHGTAVRNADNTITYTPAFGFSGADSFTYSITDGRGGAANATVSVTVSGNGVIVNPTNAKKQDLFFAATPGDDRVELVRAGKQVRVLLNGEEQGTFTAKGNVLISGGGGNDIVTLTRLKNPVIFFGGEGDDTLIGGAKADVLVGGAGNDTLNAGGGRDLIIGGDGADTLAGVGGNDLLIAGPTVYDADTPDNRRALADLLAALSARGRYAAKLAALTAPAGVAPSGATLIPGTTLFDDAAPDALDGGRSLDFFAADTDGIAIDVLIKKSKKESVIEL